MMIKKTIALIITGALLISLFAACGSNNNTSDLTTSTIAASSQVEAQSTAQATEAQDNKEVELKYVSWMSKGEDKPMAESFTKANPNIKIQVDAFDGANYDQLLKTRILSGDAPDVFLIQLVQYAPFVKQNYLADVSNEQAIAFQNNTQAIKSFMSIDGKEFGFVVNGGLVLTPVFYNKKYFEKLGVTTLPQSTDDFAALCEKIKADGVRPLVLGGKDKWPLNFLGLNYAIATNSVDYTDINKALYDGDIKPSVLFKGGLDLISTYMTKGYIGKESLTLTWPQSAQYFADGKAAMLPQGTWTPGVDEVKGIKADLGSFPMPFPVGSDGKNHIQGSIDRILVMSATTKNPEEAKKYFNYFAAPENLTQYLESQSLDTVLKGINVKQDPVLADLNAFYKSDACIPNFNFLSRVTAAFNSAAWDAYVNTMAGSPVDTELAKLDKEFDKTKAQMVLN